MVCGASQGIGRAIAREFVAAGHDVWLVARNAELLAQLQTELKAAYPKQEIVADPCDLSAPEAVEHLAERVLGQWQGVDIILHNTGGPKPATAMSLAPQDWEAAFTAMLTSAVRLNLALVPGMQERQWGRLLFISSSTVSEPMPNMALSNTIRAAVTAYAKTLSRELGADGITVNCIAPGKIDTGRLEKVTRASAQHKGVSYEAHQAELLNTVPAKRLGQPEELAALAGFLASEPAGYITGTTISVDGGLRKGLY